MICFSWFFWVCAKEAVFFGPKALFQPILVGQNFHICLLSGPRGLTPCPSPHTPLRSAWPYNIRFFTTPLNEFHGCLGIFFVFSMFICSHVLFHGCSFLWLSKYFLVLSKGTCQKLLFFPLRGYPPPTPLTENHFAKNPLAEMGGTPTPLNGKSAKLFRNFFFLRGLKMMFLDQIRLKMDQKGHMIDQKGLKMYKKKPKNWSFGPKIPAF